MDDSEPKRTFQFAGQDVIHYLQEEVNALLPELGVEEAFISDESKVGEFPNEEDFSLPVRKKYVWQLIIDRMRDKIALYEHRLEIDRYYDMEGKEQAIPKEKRHTMPDAVHCRDATIKLQDAEIARLHQRLDDLCVELFRLKGGS